MENGDTAVEVSPAPLPAPLPAPAPPAEKRPRRCVQSKLFFSPPLPPPPPSLAAPAAEGEPKQKRKRKSEPRTPKEVAVKAETLEEGKPKPKRNMRTGTPKKSPVTSTKARNRRAVTEINLSEKPDKEQEDAAGNKNCSEAVVSKSSSKNCCRMKNKQKNEATPEKVETSRHPDPKESNSQQKVNKRSTPKKSLDATDSQQRVNKRSTPKKSLDAIKLPASPPDLRLEAKIAAEENVRLSAGKQIHPFFTCSKAAKRAPEVSGLAKVDNRWSVPYGDCLDSFPPIHVFDTFADDVVSPDWKNWIFMDKASLNLNGYHAWKSTVSLFEGSIEPLKLDTLFCEGLHMDKVKGNCSTSATTLHVLPNKQDTKDEMLSNSQDYVSTSGSFLPRCASIVCKLENGDLDKLSNERFTSYYRRCSYSPQCSLWTNKYQPQNAIEVCGNKESISFLSEWLKSWHERGLESRKSAICGDKNDNEDGEDSLYEVESDMDEINDDATLKNVLLITGPIGSGKSAAIYACAQEQGFEVIEVNASDTRNGSHIKQKYGEAMESHGFNRWSSEDPIGMRKKNILELLSSSTDIEGKQIEHDSQEMISRLSNLDSAPAQFSLDIMENRAISSQVANKSLILFEDVDTVFEEDRGFISTILQLAETAKRPIILTSNNKNPVLPRVLDRSVLDFTLPSPGELLPHLYMICASEKFHVPSHVLERLSRIYLGDIRKTLMLLQFWCQGNEGTERNMQFSYSPMLCDVDAAHLVMPRVIPWEFKCELSKKVEEEISKTVAAVEDNLFMEAMQQQDPNSAEFTGLLEIGNGAVNHIKPRKKRSLKRKRSMHDESEVSTHACNLEDLSDALESPVARARRTVKHRPGTILSSQSDDQSDDGKCRPVDAVPYIATVPTPNDLEVAVDPVYQFIMDDMIHNQFDDIETASVSHVCDTFRLQDMSCVPESSLVSVAETRNDVGLSTAISSNNISATFADFIKSIHVPRGAEAEISDTPVVESCKRPTKIVGNNACELDTESSHGIDEQGDLQDEDGERRSTVYHLPDECSRVDFNMRVAPSKNRVGLPEIESVQGTWGKLRMRREDLKPHLTSNCKEACSILKLASRLADLISETDVMFGVCIPLSSDTLEPSRMPCVELDAFSWYEEQLEMGSTYAQHGLCFYTNKCSIIGSNLGCGNTPNLAQEMLTSSKSTMAMGKLLSHGNSLLEGSHIAGNLLREEPGCDISSVRQLQSELYNAVLPIVPARLSLSLRGPAFHDYLSFMSQMSISECSRLSESPNKNHRRRPRSSKHYLSSGSLPLSPEHLKLLARSRFSGEGCSKALDFGGGN